MERKREFFTHATKAKLTGEQCRVLLCLLSRESDGEIWMKQNEVAEILGLAESNVSRAIKALKDAGLLRKREPEGYDGKAVLMIDKPF
ncbi:MAG: MarR family transcriptional regulator [Candidatus Obscuribacterales bacterium]|nr:MarR family transcriptional regulator [Candidatus Obscuribacterales bacterium]